MPLRGRKSGREGGSLLELLWGQGDGAGLGMWQFLVWRTVKASSASFHRNQRNGEQLLVILIGEI